jgi:hypothetical protein
VRGVAASLLARLPDSAAAARAIDRADPFLDWSAASGTGVRGRVKSAVGGTGSRGRLQVSPPTAVDPAWESDGFSIKPPRGAGERAHWLVQALERVAPSHWARRFDASPADLVCAAWESEWGTAVLLGWSRAAVLHGDAEWTTALWDAWVSHENHDDPGYPDIRRDVLLMLLADMPIDAAEPRVAALLNRPALASTIDLAEALTRFPMPWRETLAVKVLDVIEQALSRALEPTAVYLPEVLRAAGPALPASLLARAFTIAGPQPVSLTARQLRELDLFLIRVRLRRRLHEETDR